MWRRILAAALMAVALIGVQAASTQGQDEQRGGGRTLGCGKTYTAGEFGAFARVVWREDRWERKGGEPKGTALKKMRHMRACAAGPEHRVKMRRTWIKAKHRYYHHRSYCRSGPKVEGRVSIYGGGMTGDGVHNAGEPGIAIRSTSTYGQYYRVTVDGRTATLMHFDYGPATWTGRAIDITYAGAAMLGGITTDHWGVAKMIPSDCL